MTKKIVSFEEFQAALIEEKALGEKAKKLTADKLDERAAGGMASEHPTRFELCRQFVERPSTQLLTIFFIYLDIIGHCLLPGENLRSMWNAIFHITTAFFTIELLLQALLFHTRFFSHWGCLVDTLLIAMRLVRDYSSFEIINQQHLVLLYFLRCWRFARLLNSFIDTEKQKCTALRRKLKSQIESTNDWKKKALLSEDFAKVCNDEVKTLRHALKIAADDVAAALVGKVNIELTPSVKDEHERVEVNDMQEVMEDSSISTDD
mmetsp:Transcript_28556/g.44979  ORF Transcript_28556/g.44979 Transcript_28556/m.44979 type:complete len:263 (+) Transcript_28556:194-982(+)|eukprot:CAMPEP_0201720992 /NCGR_PEP_ID=MMETSP0593-20130828/5806_1 /ASSEMBLY_ACC=CAM_ASM_000672 /TAXON_ID=267983 /ORGANISM="Skeletonema japonicum, Strain CCMP2506" /LENGTH=262 /DNA_ID=CAMNT_0048211733 /DNA_START=177 /DNA_END=965 /DNA_ORIENTATION=-